MVVVMGCGLMLWLFARHPLVVDATGGKTEASSVGIARRLFSRHLLVVAATGGKTEAR